jgi:hypothetical protein
MLKILMHNKEEKITNANTKKLIELGAEFAGSAAGGALGFFAAGPTGAAVGAIAGTAITKSLSIISDVAHRHLSDREKMRTGAGLVFALGKISTYLESGLEPRNDGFFDTDITERSKSDEVLEGTLIKCRDETEERKVRFLGNIYANVAFRSDISIAASNWLLQKADELTYRQLCILSIIKQKENKGVSWGPNDGDPAFELEYKAIEDLFKRDSSHYAIKLEKETGEGREILGLSRSGKFIYELMNLDEIPEDHLMELAPRFPRAFQSE